MIKRLKCLCACLPLLVSGMAHAQVFPDNEARRAILDLRADVKRITEDNKKNFDKIQSDKLAADLELKKSNDLIAKLQQSVRDSQLEASRLQQEIDKLNRLQNQAVLQLKSDNDVLKQQIAELRGEREQLARDITVLQRSQKDFSAGLEDRIYKLDQRFTKIEPVMVQIDGLEFQSDQAEKKDFELALNMKPYEKEISFLNRYFIFKKIRNVDAEKIMTNLMNELPEEVQYEEENTQELQKTMSQLVNVNKKEKGKETEKKGKEKKETEKKETEKKGTEDKKEKGTRKKMKKAPTELIIEE
jgi:chromosome segregation ATPase